jgi:hypothetical protein
MKGGRWVPVLALAALLSAPAAVRAQPDADPADVGSVDAIMAAVYGVISGPAGEARDWDRFRSLFVDGARLIPTGPDRDGGYGFRMMSPQEYATGPGASLEERGFFEREIHRTVERYGPVVHAFSTYESRWNADDPTPFARGINSFQLFHDGERWWVVTIYWHGETPDTPIPGRYLEGGGG